MQTRLATQVSSIEYWTQYYGVIRYQSTRLCSLWLLLTFDTEGPLFGGVVSRGALTGSARHGPYTPDIRRQPRAVDVVGAAVSEVTWQRKVIVITCHKGRLNVYGTVSQMWPGSHRHGVTKVTWMSTARCHKGGLKVIVTVSQRWPESHRHDVTKVTWKSSSRCHKGGLKVIVTMLQRWPESHRHGVTKVAWMSTLRCHRCDLKVIVDRVKKVTVTFRRRLTLSLK